MYVISFISLTLCKFTQTGVDEMKANKYQENYYQQIIDFGRTRPWVPVVGVVYLILATIALVQLDDFLTPELDVSTIQLGLSLAAFLLLLSIGSYLLTHGYRSIWGISFLIYAINFLGLCLKTLDFPFTNIDNPIIFHLWILPVVLFISSMWIAVSSFFVENKKIMYLPALFILILGESWFFISLSVFKDVELAIFGVSFGLLIPSLIYQGYIWYRFGKDSIYAPPSFLALGFSLMGLIQILWNPWQVGILGQMYFILFTLYIVSLVVIFVGFRNLTHDLYRI